ncbi:serine/arginine-rich splicing factor 11-like isoform X2 [Hoplias malabaricus]|uniref:serine/arginine-rich splicing factor 11-like isoform X2 n=1 Tax=Hoplias malabaricus TaxID=27720 RepID=UPI00346343CD
MNSNTNVVQVTNVSPSTSSEQMRTLFGFLGTIEELRLFPPDDSTMPVSSRVCFVRFKEQESVGVAQHLTNTVFVDRALIVVPYAEGVIPDESKALSLLAPANAVAGLLPGGGLLPTPNPLASIGAGPLAALGGPAMLPGAGLNPQALSAEQLLKLMTTVDPKMNPMAASMGLKADASSKEIEEAMKRVREAQSLISAAIEPGNKKDSKRKHSRSRSRSRSRRRRSRSRSRHRSRRRSRSRSRKRSRSPRRRRSRSRERGRRSVSKSRDRKKEEKDKKRSKTPPKSYSTARRSRSTSRRRRKSVSRSPRRSPKRRVSRSPSPRKHKKEKKRDREREKDRERDRDRRSERERSHDDPERSSSKKKKSKDKDKDKERERTSDSEKRDVKVTRDYDEEEQGYDSEKEREMKDSEDSGSSPARYVDERESKHSPKQSKQNGDDHHEEQDMEVSD